RTFTIGFDEADFDEAPFARAVAKHLGTRHTELTARPADALDIIPQLPQLFDEPFSDMSQLPTFLVARLARSQVTVSLSGDGADELFGGYNRYFYAHSLWKRMQAVPAPLRSHMARLIRCARPGQWDRVFGVLKPVTPFRLRFNEPGQKMHKVADILQVDSSDIMYRMLTAHWADPEQLVRGLSGLPDLDAPQTPVPPGLSLMEHMMFLDTMSYLPGDLLVKVDRTAMANSLETRAPYLNHRVVEHAWSLPLDLKIRDGQGKWILRQILYRHVPRALIERPKKGFGVPMGQWLRGSLRDWAEELLQPARLAGEGFFDPESVRQKWREHVNGIHDWQYHLWDVLVFQAWLEQQEAGRQPRKKPQRPLAA
ncbi:MAG: asparagine synthase C-terminal domain-containing protein, partial [Thiothrix sp.]|nr:asparagine synthase C-terminal domain-containing protein [Thiothrix sp.]